MIILSYLILSCLIFGGDDLNKIRALRIKANKTQKQVAEEMKMAQSTIAMWETDSANPRTDKIPLLAKVLNCSIEDLFETEAG